MTDASPIKKKYNPILFASSYASANYESEAVEEPNWTNTAIILAKNKENIGKTQPLHKAAIIPIIK